MADKLLVYIPVVTPRISYTLSLFFESLINTSYILTSDVKEYKNYQGPRLNYSKEAIAENEIFITATELLTEKNIQAQNITLMEWEGMSVFFQTTTGTLPFDVFAAAFYLVSRYEEYLPFTPDKHNRYQYTDSLAFKHNFLDVPLVNMWAEKLKNVLLKKYPEVEVRVSTYTFIPTIDVDVAYAHKGRNAFVTIGSYGKGIAKFNMSLLLQKTLTLTGIRTDDYDTFQYQKDIFKSKHVNPIYFILAGKRGEYDKNISTGSSSFSELIKELRFFANVGIHPSYHSDNKKKIVKHEMSLVEKHLQGKITKSRQHFLRITMPDTYRCLAEAGITDDYSMAYAGCVGFRASMCTPFFFYDIKKEETLPIKLHSTIIMDGTLNEYMNLTPDEAIVLIKKLIVQVRKYNGEFIGIWHNDTMNDKGKWLGWKKVFETYIDAAV